VATRAQVAAIAACLPGNEIEPEAPQLNPRSPIAVSTATIKQKKALSGGCVGHGFLDSCLTAAKSYGGVSAPSWLSGNCAAPPPPGGPPLTTLSEVRDHDYGDKRASATRSDAAES